MSYKLKIICYFVKTPNYEGGDIGEYVKQCITSAYFTNSSMIKDINIINDSGIVNKDSEFISWVEGEIVFYEEKEKVINRMKVLNMQTFVQKLKNEVKYNGNSDYLTLFIGAL